MKMNKKKNIPLLRSFLCAAKGLICAIKNERNMRIHLCFCFYIAVFFGYYNFTHTETAIIVLAVGFVIVAELLNTAIETVVDLVSPDKNKLAGLAKDVAAGGVFVSAAASFIVGIIFFMDFDTVKKIISDITENPLKLLLLLISVLVWVTVIFLPNSIKNKKDDK